MTDSNDIEELKHQIVDVTDELVGGDITAEDMYFVLLLFEEYYQSAESPKFHSVTTANIAWEFANQMASVVENTEDFDWFNAYFVADGLHTSVQDTRLDAVENDDTINTHPEQFTYSFESSQYDSNSELFNSLETVQNDIVELLELYVDLETTDDTDEISDTQLLQTFFHNLKKRYASEFSDDILESSISFEFCMLISEATKDDTVTSQREVERALYFVTEWTNFKAHYEHDMLTM